MFDNIDEEGDGELSKEELEQYETNDSFTRVFQVLNSTLIQIISLLSFLF